MDFGLYAAYLGMRARQRNLDAIANNIANAATTGFKADRLLYRSVEAMTAGPGNPSPNGTTSPASTPQTAATTNPTGATSVNSPVNTAASTLRAGDIGVLTGSATDYSAGAIRQTGNPLDVALNGPGFLVVQTAQGERYTRAGSLMLDATGQLVTQSGDLVVGDSGAISLPPGEPVIGEDGTISVNRQVVGRLKLVNFTDPHTALTKDGTSLFAATGSEQPSEAVGTRVQSGALEASNVNPVSEMAAMMQNSREFESLQHSVSMMLNDLGRKVNSEIGAIQ